MILLLFGAKFCYEAKHEKILIMMVDLFLLLISEWEISMTTFNTR